MAAGVDYWNTASSLGSLKPVETPSVQPAPLRVAGFDPAPLVGLCRLKRSLMCGIAALFSDYPDVELQEKIRLSLDLVAHRGPDGSGIVSGTVDGIVGNRPATWSLGHVRLAILDLTDAGAQPMKSRDGLLWITYNGEVYNFVELAAELKSLGYQFETRSDTEVLLAAYREWGAEAVNRFRGMFALLIVDLTRSVVFAARDRLGIKPLYFWAGKEQTHVVSEPKQLLSVGEFQPRLQAQQCVDYLTEGLLGHEPSLTMFDQVHALPAGHCLTWSLGERPKLANATSYWQPSRSEVAVSWQDAVQQIEDVFCDSVRLRLRSDVPVGTCLSGGIDSSSIVTVAFRDFSTAMRTFSVCNDDPRINEQPYIDAVNRECQAEPVKFFLTDDDAEKNLDQFIYHQDEPTFSLSQYGEFCVMRLAREHGVPVLLNGQGGDEALCGYRKFAFFYLKQLLSEHRYAAATSHLLGLLAFGDRQLLQIWQGTRYAPSWLKRRYDVMTDVLKPDWYRLSRSAWRSQMKGVVDLHEHQWEDLRRWSLPILLRYQDRNSMAHSVEARVPMVDHEFIELALTFPTKFFFTKGMTKRVLVDAMGDRLPEMLRRRKTKLGFDTPQARWMKGRLGELLEERVRACDRLEPILHREVACKAFRDYRQGAKQIPHFFLYRMACLAVWLDRFQVSPN